MKRYFLILLVLLCPLAAQAQGEHIVLNGSSQYLDGTTPTQTSFWPGLFEGRLNSARLGHATDQVVFDMVDWGTLTIKAVSGGITNLEFNPAVADGTVTLNITAYTAGFMWRTSYDGKKLIFGLQVWDLRGINTISTTAVTTTTSINMSNRAFRLGAKLDGTLHCQMDLDFFRWIGPISSAAFSGTLSIGQTYTPFPAFGDVSYHIDCADFAFSNNLNNSGTGINGLCQVATLTSTGSPTYSVNANTQPVAKGEDRTGQAKGTILLNGTESYDYEFELAKTLSANWTCVSAPGAGCGALTIRDPSIMSTFADGATAAGSYTFSFTVVDNSGLTSTDSTVTIEVVAVSANAGPDISCFVDEACLVDGSATTGHQKVTLDFGDGSIPTRIPKTVHQYRSVGAKTVTVTAYDAQAAPTSSSDTATVTVSARPVATGPNTEDLTDSGNANFISLAQCTADPTGNLTKLQNAINIAAGRNTAQQLVKVRANNGSGSQCEYRGQITIPNTVGTSQILVESSAAASLPPSYKRVCGSYGVCSSADLLNMPKLVVNAANIGALITANGTNVAYYKFRGLHIDATVEQGLGIVILGDQFTDDTLAEIPHDMVFQHCVVRPTNEFSVNVKNGVVINANRVVITDSIIGPNSFSGIESHGTLSFTSAGEQVYTNNFISAGSSNAFWGGAVSSIDGLTPTNIEYRENHTYRNPAWKPSHPQWDGKARAIKNLFEFKNAANANIIGNVFEENWSDAQAGMSIVFADAWDSGDWAKQHDIDFAFNYLKNLEAGISIRGRDYQDLVNQKRYTLRHNLIELTHDSPGTQGFYAILAGPSEVRFEHMTARKIGTAISRTTVIAAGGLSENQGNAGGFVYEDSIADHGTYGWFASVDSNLPNDNLPGAITRYSLAVCGSCSASYPAGQNWQFPINEDAVQFTNAAGLVWSLAAGSPYKNDASDETDPGVNWTALQAAILHTVDGDWTQSTPGTDVVMNISELRTSGPNGAGDDFVEIYNNSDTPHTVPAGGYGLFKRGVDCNALPVLIGTIPATTVIPARGHYLFVGSTFSLGSYAAGDVTLTADIESDFNVGLFSTVDPLAVSTSNRLDAVGFGASTGGVCDLLREGTTLGAASGSTSQYTFARKFSLVGNNVPTPTDANNNATDFNVVSTTPSTAVGTNGAPILGAPGPENLMGPNLKKFSQVGAALLDATVSSATAPNRVRRTCSDPEVEECDPNRSALGTISFRRKFTNNTGGNISRLRFRIYDISTFPVPVGTADLRAITSGQIIVTGPGIGTVTVEGTTLEEPPAQALGGGLNSGMAAGTITLANQLPNGSSINLQFLCGVQQDGGFRIFVFVEALPSSLPAETVLVADDFNDNSLDTAKWNPNDLFSGFTNTNVPIAETEQRLEIGPLLQNVAGSSYRGIRTVNSYNFSGAYSYVELVQAPDSNTAADAMFTIGNDVNAYYRIYVSAGTLFGQRKIGATKTTLFSTPYDAVNHRFLRIRHDSATGNVTLDTAPGSGGAPGTWVQRFTETWNSSISTSAIIFEVKGGTSQVEASPPGKVIFDNFRAAIPG